MLVATALCWIFGLMIIVNTSLGGTPMWFWYTELFHQGHHLYSELHLTLQPVLILEMNAWMRLVGVSVLADELLAVFHLTLLLGALFLVIRETRLSDPERGVLLIFSYLSITFFNAYLFDDYHIHSNVYALLVFWSLLRLRNASAKCTLQLATIIGVLSGLAVTTRINDGAAIFLGALICIPFFTNVRRWRAIAGCFLAAMLTVSALVLLTGDSLAAWARNSIFAAAGSKGGAGVFMMPLRTIHNSWIYWRAGWAFFLLFPAMVCLPALFKRFWPRYWRWSILCMVLIAGVFCALLNQSAITALKTGWLAAHFTPEFVFIAFLAVVGVAFQWLWHLYKPHTWWDNRETLVVPVFLLVAAGSASSAGWPADFHETVAYLFIIAALLLPARTWWKPWSAGVLTMLLLISATLVSAKWIEPYSWLSYRDSPMFRDRIWFRHPVYGPMYMERSAYDFYMPACELMQKEGSDNELLSLPYPQLNYYCNIPPWHNYVQTFFDTSSRATIERLMGELETNPPKWISYQRQLKNLSDHETLYNRSQPLPHRALDALILQKVQSGQWRVVERSDWVPGDGWFLIRTR